MNTKPCNMGGRWGIGRQWTVGSIIRRNFKIFLLLFFFSVKFCNNVGKIGLGSGVRGVYL